MSVCSNRTNCRAAQLCYYDLLDVETAKSVPGDVHEHVASCADCRSDIDRLRGLLASASKKVDSEQRRRDSAITELLSLHFAWVDEVVGCEQARPFLASLADPLLHVRVPTPITAHLDNCRACSQDLSTIEDSAYTHEQLCRLGRILAADPDEDADSPEVRAAFPIAGEILGRPESEIVTRFTFDESAQSGSDEPRANPAINVEVIDRQQSADAQHDYDSSAHKLKTLILKLKRYKKPTIAAAAVLLVGLGLLFTNSAAKAVTLGQIMRDFKRAENVHVSQFLAGQSEPLQEQWVSRSRSIYMSRTGQLLVLFDAAGAVEKSRDTIGAKSKEKPLTADDSDNIRKLINGSLGLTPTETDSGISPDTKLHKVPPDALPPEAQGFELYDLTWTARDGRGKEVFRKWRYFVEPESGLSRRVECRVKSSTDGEYNLRMWMAIEPLGDAEMDAVIEGAFS